MDRIGAQVFTYYTLYLAMEKRGPPDLLAMEKV